MSVLLLLRLSDASHDFFHVSINVYICRLCSAPCVQQHVDEKYYINKWIIDELIEVTKFLQMENKMMFGEKKPRH